MISWPKLDTHDGRWNMVEEAAAAAALFSVWRVEGVPSDKVQSTEEGEEQPERATSWSSSVDCFPVTGKTTEK